MTSHVLGELDAATFLRDYWQRKPLLIRQALPAFESPLSPDELAGLALEEDVESRIVLDPRVAGRWKLLNGPFEEAGFASLPNSHWTLLVQDVEKHLPQLADLLEPFRFVPDWRIDDLMISYAAPGGSVGPHVDRYDVFLLQGHGRRRWQIVDPPPRTERLRDDADLRVLAEFEPTREWELEPGDMLYLPPGIPHHGVAVDACMTYSIGFRAPAWREVLAEVLERVLEEVSPESLYRDPPLAVPGNPGRIDPDALRRVRAWVRGRLRLDDGLIDEAFAATVTRPKPQFLDRQGHAATALARELVVHPATRLALLPDRPDGAPQLFVDGEHWPLRRDDRGWVEALAGQRRLSAAALRAMGADARALVARFVEAGQLIPVEDDERTL